MPTPAFADSSAATPFSGRVAFLLNPAAANGRAVRRRSALEATVAASGMDAEVHVSAGPDRTEPLARLLAETFDAVIAVGGDGTVHAVANALAGTETRFGALPMGTGNDFARAIGMPFDMEAGVRAIAGAFVRPLDVASVRWTEAGGSAHALVVANCLGAGFDADAAARAGRFKSLGGRSAYAVAVVKTLWAWRRPGVRVEVALDDTLRGAECPVGAGGAVVFSGSAVSRRGRQRAGRRRRLPPHSRRAPRRRSARRVRRAPCAPAARAPHPPDGLHGRARPLRGGRDAPHAARRRPRS